VEAVHRTFIALDVQVRRMTWVNAEIAKIAVNTFVTTKISYANMLAELCEHLPGGDIDVVTDAIGVDRRIGHAYLRAAVG
jgi:UDPglucose 6-dehydrogenase